MIFDRLRHSAHVKLIRYELLGALIFAGLVPYLTRLWSLDTSDALSFHTQTFLIVCLSTSLGYWFTRNFTTYPGVEKTSYILTSLASSYGIILAVLVFFRVDYSRFMLFAGFVLSLVWFYFTKISSARQAWVRVGLAPLTGDVADLESYPILWVRLTDAAVIQHDIDAVAADLRVDMEDDWERALADYALAGVPVFHIKHLRESITGQVALEHISESNFGSLSPVSAYMSIKHLLDALLAALALLVVAPVLLCCAVLIRATSAGPALFRQQRVGYQGRSFTVYKLRTMKVAVPGEDARDAAMTKDADARVTPIGRFLRQSRLDELPQLLNVLKGEMSLIGPRPEAEVLSKWYEAEIPFYRYRHIVRPGITGWAQVNQGHVADVSDVRTKLNYDFYYIKNFSPWLDMLIVARTIRTMVTGFGAR
ncbi:exopolysaccharide biosynthesis polyprenyl glycosylphosphotransferase [Sphingomonas sp. CD22]|uniref:exopolysaccharide biosynthesis polyprenyl glycosylphosphotransferase n=1 Tax=Sphingomonas sp. CD22 TaxID=3100214 RepID=UPI002ADF2BFF|nr:exopolysaccharide biosynthesis polyprenyl glycosylphosphotransferase [Sphingomonas sp. CD22]MEA1085872.1 exopolysaccharide biosynthesis polyprenyl glycosylphosphotransferase [Sphingomonas sp. CD22]